MLPEGSELRPQSALAGIERKKYTEIMGSIVGVPDPYDHASNVSHEVEVSICKMVVLGEKGDGKSPSEPAGFCIHMKLMLRGGKIGQHTEEYAHFSSPFFRAGGRIVARW